MRHVRVQCLNKKRRRDCRPEESVCQRLRSTDGVSRLLHRQRKDSSASRQPYRSVRVPHRPEKLHLNGTDNLH